MNRQKAGQVCFVEVLSILGAIAVVMQSYYMGKIVDNAHTAVTVVLTMVLVILGTMVIEIVTKIAKNYLVNKYTNKRRFALHEMLADRLLHANYCELESMEAGNVLNIYTNDIEKILKYEEILFTIGATFVKVIVSLGFLFHMNVLVSVCILMASIAALIPGMLVGNFLYGKNKQLSKKEDELNEHFLKHMSLIKLIKSYNVEKYYADKNDTYIDQYGTRKKALHNNAVMYSVLNRVFGLFPFMALFMVGAIFTLQGRFTIGSIIAASFFTGILCEGIDELQNVFSVKQSYKAAKERLQAIASLAVESDKRTKKHSEEAAITFENVGFAYPDGTRLWKNMNLQIPEGSKVLVRGRSGCGKTTLFRLIEGLYEPTRGSISIGTKKQKKVGAEPVISAADQESILFPRTVRENICIGNEHLTEAQFQEICETVCIDDSLLYREKEERVIADMGTNLSKGQLQRINIARALAKEADIYLFDEPTSGLSADMEKQVIENMMKYLQHKTVMMIMHESKFDDLFDQVIEMDAVCSSE